MDNSRPILKLLPALLMSAVLSSLALPASAAIKCWENSEGVRECGNSVPPEYAQQGYDKLNDRGLTIDTNERAKTLEELTAEREAEKVAEAKAEEQKKQEQSDRVLLDTFASEDDLVLTRDGQIGHLDSQIRLTHSHLDKLKQNLDQMIERAADVERRGDTPSDKMIANIQSVRDQIEENEDFIATKQAEQAEIRERFAADIERFRELKKSGH